MIKKIDKNANRLARHTRVRKKISGTADRPRLDVYRSNSHIYAQVIDDTTGNTLAAASTIEAEVQKAVEEMTKTEAAKTVGKLVAERAQAKGIKEVVSTVAATSTPAVFRRWQKLPVKPVWNFNGGK